MNGASVAQTKPCLRLRMSGESKVFALYAQHPPDHLHTIWSRFIALVRSRRKTFPPE